MRRALITICCVAMVCSLAAADRLILNDGRVFSGKVVVKPEDDTVWITVSFGTLSFPKSQVARIEFAKTPEEELSDKLSHTPSDDPDRLAAVARWAGHEGLDKQSREIYETVLKLDPNHAAARAALGYLRVAGAWLNFDQVVQRIEGQLGADQPEAALRLARLLRPIATTAGQRLTADRLIADSLLRNAAFADAQKIYKNLAGQAEGAAALRYAAVAGVLKAHPDGMYILMEAYPPADSLLGNETESLRPGPVSLADPRAMEAALLAMAREDIAKARTLLKEARRAEVTDPRIAQTKYLQATRALDRADALSPDVGKSYRLEIVRRRIAMIRKTTDADAKTFDKALAELGKKDMSPQAYRRTVLGLIRNLDNVRDGLKEILKLSKPFSRELIMEVKWAEVDMEKIESMREILLAELENDR